MKTKFFITILFLSLSIKGFCTITVINNSGNSFSPSTVTINFGDSVRFNISFSHDAREVSQATWSINGNAALLNGFQTVFGGGLVLPAKLAVGTHYYVCTPHASMSMKGTIVVQGCVTPVQPGVINGNAIACSGSVNTYSVLPVPNALSYTWGLPSGWTGTSTTNSINVTAGPLAGNISVIANNLCGASIASTLSLTSAAIPATPSAVATTGGIAKVCVGDTRTYTVNLVSGVTWNWIVPIGAVINSGQGTNSINVTYNAGFIANGVISVVAVNACGNSLPRNLTIARNIAAMPGAITGIITALCGATNVAYSVPNVVGVTYIWAVPAGVTIVNGQNTNAITVNYPLAAFSGSIAVAATLNNACGASAQRKITVKGVPATPAGITGTTVVCSNQFGVPYSIAPIPTATSYTWIGTPGSYISDGVVTSAGNSLTTSATSVTVNYGSTAGTLRARANNVCGVGAARSINILINCRLATDDTPIKLHIYPQPTNEWVTLKYNSIENQYCEMWITDIAGRSMLHERLSASIGENENLIDVSNLANGIYLVSLKMSNRELTGKMVKQ